MASRFDDTALKYLTRSVLSLKDDPSLPWRSYPCLLWDRNFYWDGYGKVKVAGTHARAHRLAWVLMHGEISKQVLVCHHCDTPACFRPAHLFAGNNSANMLDCSAKGRHRGNQVLTKEQAMEIRTIYKTKTLNQYELAEKFSVTQPTISDVVNLKRWRHI